MLPIKNKNVFLAVGQLSLAMSILLNHFVNDTGPVSFLIGLFTGLSIVFNAAFIWFLRKE
ncbi:MAG: hypothetical protein EHM64_10670 [Ignavibacteriae bacterium]|nr:MAG: hypothetical protein EHM64_10670 [Ignavibacteriota bacterium]